MEWEDRFSSIMKETEANLARVQARLHSSSSQPDRTFSRIHSRPSAMIGRTQLLSGTSRHSSVTARPHSSPVKPSSPGLTTSQLSAQTSPTMINVLIERLEDQAEIITSVSNQVQQLQREKDAQTEIIYRLQDEVGILHERIKEQGIDLPTEQKLIQFKQELRGEMEDLQSQIRVSKNNTSRDIFTDTSFSALARDLKDSKRMDQDERDSLRRELDSLRTRLVKAELELQSVLGEMKDVIRKQDKVERAVTNLSDTQCSQSRSLSQLVDDQQLGALQFSEMRNILSELKNAINEVETDVMQLQTSGDLSHLPPRRRKNKLGSKPPRNNYRNGKGTKSQPSSKPAQSENASIDHQSLVSSDSDLDMSIATAELDVSDTDSVSLSTHNNTITKDITGSDVNSSGSLSSLDSDDLLSEIP